MNQWRLVSAGLAIAGSSVLLLLFQNAASSSDCSQAEMAEILAEPTGKNWAVKLKCSPQFRSTDVVKKTLFITGNVSGIEVLCSHNKTTGQRTTFTRSKAIADEITAAKMPEISTTDAAAEDAIAEAPTLSLANDPVKILQLIDRDVNTLEFFGGTLDSRKKHRSMGLYEFQDLRNLEGKLAVKISILRTYRKALLEQGASVRTQSIYRKFRAALTFDTNPSGSVGSSKIQKLIASAKANKYITDPILRIIEKQKMQYAQRILVASHPVNGGETWQVPKDILIKNCRVEGGVRLAGVSPNGEDGWYGGKFLTKSSKLSGHTARTQARAPKKIYLENLIVFDGKVYFAPGVTESELISSTLVDSTLYLDAESENNTIEKNFFYSRFSNGNQSPQEREFISLDGSKGNLVAENQFGTQKYPMDRGGVYIYRNCGENGVSRHLISHDNTIEGNKFVYKPKNTLKAPAVWVNSRYGKSTYYCSYDDANPYGSGKKNNDEYVRGTKVKHNATYKWNDKNGKSLQVENSNESNISNLADY